MIAVAKGGKILKFSGLASVHAVINSISFL